MKIKNIVVTVVFCLFITLFFLLSVFHTPIDVSESERRPLAQAPELSLQGIINGSVMEEIEDFTADQFPFRDSFRKLYTWYRMNVMQLKDTNDLAFEDGYIAKVESGLNEKSIEKVLKAFNYIYENYLKDNGGKTYLSIIPDKNYFFSKEYGYISMDYDRLVKEITEGLPAAEYIDIFGTLELEDYYKTDTHWSQDKILLVAETLAQRLGVGGNFAEGGYEKNSLYPFYGVYHGQSALDLPPETIYYLTNDVLDKCTVFDYETGETTGLYTIKNFDSKEPYDIFLGGTKAMLRIDNPLVTEKKELVVFRDSFGSSLLPLLSEGYSSIYVVDIRYISAGMLESYINFEKVDALFLYSTLILNSNPSFK
ncbi:MAG: hypothetical protein IKU61_03320 [Clostridia bacterium]|nr:hypothetical protein [Clostridia bacterium]